MLTKELEQVKRQEVKITAVSSSTNWSEVYIYIFLNETNMCSQHVFYVLDHISGGCMFARPTSGKSAVFLRIATPLRCGLRIPRGPSCGTPVENRALIVRCCNPTQWHRAQIKGCWAECALCMLAHKQYALQRTRRARQFTLVSPVMGSKDHLQYSVTITPVLLTPVCSFNGFKKYQISKIQSANHILFMCIR